MPFTQGGVKLIGVGGQGGDGVGVTASKGTHYSSDGGAKHTFTLEGVFVKHN